VAHAIQASPIRPLADPEDTMSDDPPAAALLGRELLTIDAATGEVRLRYQARAEFANRHGTIQGGFLAAMLDSAAGLALVSLSPAGTTAVTVRLDVAFLKPGQVGVILAGARIIARDGRSASVRAELTDRDGVVLATAEVELRVLRPKPGAA
jgi:uncharacterized protein (TIGR00369 family)